MISATPYLTDTYYFNKGDQITFNVKMLYNGTGGDIDTIKLKVSSTWLTFHSCEPVFTVCTAEGATFDRAVLFGGETAYGNVTVIVKSSIGPLSQLDIELTANATFSSGEIYIPAVKSTPTVFAVFPGINVTREHNLGKLVDFIWQVFIGVVVFWCCWPCTPASFNVLLFMGMMLDTCFHQEHELLRGRIWK